ncbi:efflux RND transporter permease subunit [Anaeromyxobacter sp. PSR-1]|uniref:efflux RND transporter permease subunit n=1 Tax=Anaeromyxobacter sp. PSR-1 TaxID=1300915 RepID=UPI0005E459D2|nr:efflux RND transporter permease subunit [Anaeromyxobacter sp. PSR-1]GAO01480.1 protein HelA [Anaeromyxobacter sp. PSR-1]
MWIVRLALSRPHTFVVGALLLLLSAPLVLLRMPTDIFPSIDIPVVSVIWLYNGLSAQEIEQRIVYNHERMISSTVDGVEHTESTSYNGAGVIKVFLHAGGSVDAGVAQVTASAQAILRRLPPGQTPPIIIRYNASTVPILQYSLSSRKLSEQELQDLAFNQVRVGLANVKGASVPYPYGGKTRLVSVDLDLAALEARRFTPLDVVNAINAQSFILPSGTAKIGPTEYDVAFNSSPEVLDALNDLPVRAVEGAVIRVRDLAHVHDGAEPQQNVVRLDGVRGVLLTILKSGAASTLDVVRGVKATMPRILAGLPPELDVREFADQSLFVRAAVNGLVREGVVAALLTAAMILLFLGSWRSTFIIALSIPLSVLSSIVALNALGETINLMTLGGLALAVGILVDDATVTIENVHRHLAMGKSVETAILDGAQEIALPAFVGSLSIAIVFVPMFLLTGTARYLFVPLGEAVVFAVLASYVLSRTLVPTLVMWLYRGSAHGGRGVEPAPVRAWLRPLVRIHAAFEIGFERLRAFHAASLGAVLRHRRAALVGFGAFCAATALILPLLGRDFFPTVDSGQLRLHLRAPSGTRIEETARLTDEVERAIRAEIPAAEVAGILDNIGIPSGGIPLTYIDSGLVGTADADILVSLRTGHAPTDRYARRLRARLSAEFPGTTFYFLPADIVSQTLNFGLPAPFDIQIVGRDQAKSRAVAYALAEQIRQIPGAVDVRVQQPSDLPRLQVAVDRTKASQMGLSARDVASSLLLSLSGSSQAQPAYWLNPRNGVQYLVNARVPQTEMDSLEALGSIPAGASRAGEADETLLANVATISRSTAPPVFSHRDIQPVIDVYGGVAGRDLGGVVDDLQPLVARAERELPPGSYLMLRGQAETMRSSFAGLGLGLLAAVVLAYLLLVVNFQSWTDPFIIVSALPAALAGVVWGLYLTFTPLSVPALMGAIMSLGVATANSVLVVSFARASLRRGLDPVTAGWEAAGGRLRPVLMTAAAMIIGMIPLALGLGEGGEQNAPLGRAVIGGLLVATAATLFLVPAVFATLHRASSPADAASPPAA